MTRLNLKKSVLALAVVTGSLVSGQSNEASAGCHRQYRSRVIYTQPIQPVTTVITKATVVTKVVTAKPVRQLLSVPQGSSMRIKVNFLGSEPGLVFMTSGTLTMECPIQEWSPTFVVFQLPEIGVIKASEVRLDVAKADGKVARTVDVRLTPTPDVEVIQSASVIPRAPRKVSGNRPTINTGGLSVATER